MQIRPSLPPVRLGSSVHASGAERGCRWHLRLRRSRQGAGRAPWRWLPRLGLLLAFAVGPAAPFARPATPPGGPALRPNDLILFYGNAMVERLLEAGTLEAQVQLAAPSARLRLRSLAWTGDEVGFRLRPEGYAGHMKSLLAAWPASVIVLGYGMNESFAGAGGLDDFRRQYDIHLGELARRHPGASFVLLSPLAVVEPGAPNAAARNANLAAYTDAIADLARRHRARFIDLYAASRERPSRPAEPLTEHGIHLTAAGAREIGRVVATALTGRPPVEPGSIREAELAAAAARKHTYVAELVRPKNAALYYGVRFRPDESEAELPRYHRMVELHEAIVHELAARPAAKLADFPEPTLPPLPPGRITPYKFQDGAILSPEDMLGELKTPAGYAVNLFASEERFPELRNPLQLAFDARGRLWVVTMPSFPHTIPGEQPNDRILILEDTNRDGRADTCTVFAGGFDALDGVAFHERGVIVSAQPRLLLLNDTNGDGRADTQRELLRGVDVTDSHHGGMVATDPLGQVIFSEGVFHRSQYETPFGVVRGIDQATYRLDPATGRVSAEYPGNVNPWKVSFDRYGNLYQRYGGGHLLDGMLQVWQPFGSQGARPGEGVVLNYGKGSALSVISSPNFPDAFQQGVATAALLGRYVVSLTALSVGGGAMRRIERLDVLTSANSTFRPVDVEFGFDGALYVSDFSSPIIGHAQHAMRDPQWNHVRGRIWRVVHTERPLVRDWPQIEGAALAPLLELLVHPQNVVRHHARIELRRRGADAVAALDAWVAARPQVQPALDQARLEASWVLAAAGQVRPRWVDGLFSSADPRYRAAAVQLLRLTAPLWSDAHARLTRAAADSDARVRAAVLNAVSHLRRADSSYESILAHYAHGHTPEPAERGMLEDLALGTQPLRGRSVPVLDIAPETEIRQWLEVGSPPVAAAVPPPPTGKTGRAGRAPPPPPRRYRTFLDAATAQPAVLSVKHAFLDLSVNGVQVLSADFHHRSEHQVGLSLEPGLNTIEIEFRRMRNRPPVFVYDAVGQPLAGVRTPDSPERLAAMATRWAELNADTAGALRVHAVPNLLQFSPRELRVKAGQRVRLIFENPDLMPHNLVLVAVGAAEKIGELADRLAGHPDGVARAYVPDSPQVLQATPLLNPREKAELRFTVPSTPGHYPFLCTFPGHWRVMRGVLIVE